MRGNADRPIKEAVAMAPQSYRVQQQLSLTFFDPNVTWLRGSGNRRCPSEFRVTFKIVLANISLSSLFTPHHDSYIWMIVPFFLAQSVGVYRFAYESGGWAGQRGAQSLSSVGLHAVLSCTVQP